MIRFTVLGVPVGKGRPKFSTANGHAVAYTPAKTTNYETLVRLSYQQQCNKYPFKKDEELAATIVAYFPIPKSTSKKNQALMQDCKIRHTKKPDCDNVAKAVLDALNGIAYYDDSQIVALDVRKFYSDEPRIEILIRELTYKESKGKGAADDESIN